VIRVGDPFIPVAYPDIPPRLPRRLRRRWGFSPRKEPRLGVQRANTLTARADDPTAVLPVVRER
jgi:hypothetical protein